MRAVDVIRAKRDGQELSNEQIDAFVHGATHRGWEDYQLSALLMAICLKGMTPAETGRLTRAMAESGARIDLSDIPGPKVDKHSTGGVGDKTSLILAPLAAACGVVVPMMSGRGLGHTGGTLDKLAAIPGFRTDLTENEFRIALEKVGVGMIGQTKDVAPADKKLYALRDVTATVESVPLITASILSKKLAEGISGLVMDVKCGRGAYMKNRTDAATLAQSLVSGAKANGLACEAVLTAMDAPLGRAVGNALEVVEAIETLTGHGPTDLTDLSVSLAASMVRMAGLAATDADAEASVRSALLSGAGLDVFRRMIDQQGGDPNVVDDTARLPRAPKRAVITTAQSGCVLEMDAFAVGTAAMILGAGRKTVRGRIDPAVGVVVRVKPGETIQAGEAIYDVRYRKNDTLPEAASLLESSYKIGEAPPANRPTILDTIR
ncbi:MAG TPA: thymidine phosphorylase [Fimbriiglobus sp.]|jgi:pyrimidine-nucleoside phosphorylase